MRKLAFLFLSLFAFCTASAQVTTSSMSGRVADTDGQPIIGATIVAVHTPTGTQYATASTRNGQFNLGGMRVGGPYDVEVSFIGCNTEKIEGIYLTIGEEATLDFVLREDSQSIGEVVVVGKANPVFNANRTGAQEVVTLEMMEKLPTTSRSLDEFVKLTPMSSGKNFAGTSYRFNNVTVDGASFNNSFGLSSALGAQGTEPISLESIEPVQVMIAPYDVRNGGSTGGGIKTTTFFVLMQQVRSIFSKRRLGAFHRRLPDGSLAKAATITLMGLIVVSCGTFALCILEPETDFLRLLFEQVSAYSTAGLSTGITAGLRAGSKAVLIFTMFIGRVGAVTLLSLWVERPEPSAHYTEEAITIG